MKQFLYILTTVGLVFCGNPEQNEHPAEEITSLLVGTQDFTITNLYDAFGKSGNGTTKDFGFSALITYHGKTILFDAGTNADILKNNVEALGIDLASVDFAVASHAHGDHINGFDYLLEVNPEVKIYLPFDFYTGAKIKFNIEGRDTSIVDSLPDEMKYFGGESDLNLTINQSGRFWKANTEYIKENVEIEAGVKLVTTRSPYLGYGSKYPSVEEMKSFGNEEVHLDDGITFVGLPELSLSLATDNGEVLLVGCSHSSVQKIVTETRSYTNEPIQLVYGGYHMLPYGREEVLIVAYQLKDQLEVKQVAPAHCTGHLAFKLLKDVYGEDYVFAGLGERIIISY